MLEGMRTDSRPFLYMVRRQALGALFLGDYGRGLRGGLQALPLQPQPTSSAGYRLLGGAQRGKESLKGKAGRSLFGVIEFRVELW